MPRSDWDSALVLAAGVLFLDGVLGSVLYVALGASDRDVFPFAMTVVVVGSAVLGGFAYLAMPRRKAEVLQDVRIDGAILVWRAPGEPFEVDFTTRHCAVPEMTEGVLLVHLPERGRVVRARTPRGRRLLGAGVPQLRYISQAGSSDEFGEALLALLETHRETNVYFGALRDLVDAVDALAESPERVQLQPGGQDAFRASGRPRVTAPGYLVWVREHGQRLGEGAWLGPQHVVVERHGEAVAWPVGPTGARVLAERTVQLVLGPHRTSFEAEDAVTAAALAALLHEPQALLDA